MKKKIFLVLAMMAMLICLLAISVSAAALTNFADVKLTFVDGTEATAYIPRGDMWNGYRGYNRQILYADYKDNSTTYAWNTVKIFDMRESQIFTYDSSTDTLTPTGTYPQTLLKGPSEPSNVTHVYYPQGAEIIASSSFMRGRGWTSLEYVWIPKTVKEISFDCFRGTTTLTTVEFEKGSNLKIIGTEAFRECKNLENISLPEGLETISYCAFYTTNLSGTFVVPNSVTSIGDAAFRTTKIEKIYFGDGPVTLGYNLIGNDYTDNTYLEEVYIPANATFSSNIANMWFKTSEKTINFYVIASEGEDVSTFVSNLKATGRVKFATEEEIKNGTAVSGYNAVIKLGYNKCDAFYKGEHNNSNDLELSFTDFLTGFCEVSTCTNCNKKVPINDTYEPIFKFVGYSTKENGTALCVGYTVNKKSLDVYNEYSTPLEYGVVASVVEDGEGLDLLTTSDGEVVANSKYLSVIAPVSTEYAGFDFVLSGFGEKHMDLNIAMCAYVYDGESISYLSEVSEAEPTIVTMTEILKKEAENDTQQ